MTMFASMCVGLAAAALAVGPEVTVQTLDNRSIRGTLAELSAERLVVESPEGPTTLEIGQVLGVSLAPAAAVEAKSPQAWVELADGSTLLATSFRVAGSKAAIELADGRSVEAPIDAIVAARLQEAPESVLAEWDRIVQLRSLSDVLVTRKDAAVNYLKGAVHDIDDETVQFDYEGERIPVKRAKVLGVVYRHQPGRRLPEPVCALTDASGSHWAVRTVRLEDEWVWETSSGVSLRCPIDRLRHLDFSAGKIVFLSDLKPESVRFTPFFGSAEQIPSLAAFYAPRMDRGFASKTLSLGGTAYARGIAMHSRTEIIYRLPGRFRRFEAVAGIDDAVRPGGNVRLVIRADQRVLLDATLRGADAPRTIDLPLDDARRLTILADFGEELGIGDYLNLCNARVIR